MNVIDYIRLTRPYMVLCAAAAFVAGVFVSGATISKAELFGGITSIALSIAGWFVLNDVFDRDRDIINKPERSIASGRVQVKSGILFAAALFIVSLVMVFRLPVEARLWLAAIAPILLLYSQLKVAAAWAANVATAIVGAVMAIVGAAAAGQYGYSWLIAVFAFLCILGREIIKDIEDIRGDREVGLKTLPIMLGKRNSLRITMLLWGATIIAVPIPYALGVFSLGYLVLALAAGLLLSISLSTLKSSMSQKHLSSSLRLSQYSLVLGAIAFAIAV